MPSPVAQIIAASYNAVLAEARKPANQWAQSSFLAELDRQGGLEKKPLGAQIDAALDYQINPGAGFTVGLAATSLAETDVVTSALYDIAELQVPVTWTKKTEAQNPSENQKIALVKSLLTNGFSSHDDRIEYALFQTSTTGFLGLNTHVTTTGLGSTGGIDGGTYAWWRNQQATYLDDTDIEAVFTIVWDQCAKGSGSDMVPTLMVSGATTQAMFEGSQQGLQRYETQDLKAGFRTLMFKTARYVFSQYGGTNVYFLNPKNFKLIGSSTYFRDKGETRELQAQAGYTFSIYSALQSVTTNRSRLGVAHL
jgi:hypothetical protein